MAIVTTDSQHYSDIADAIRDKGVSGSFKPSQMASAIEQIEGGGGGTDYLQYATHLANAFEDAVFNVDDLTLNIPNNTTLLSAFYHANAVMGVKNITLNIGDGKLTTMQECFRGDSSLETITINGTFASSLLSAFITGTFRACRVLKSINGTPLPKLAGTNTWMQCYALEEVRFKHNIQSGSCTFADCAALSDASLVSIANALIVGSATLTLHATPKGRLNSIMGNVADGVFTKDASGSTTLRDFITQIKGWTIA